MRIQRKNISSLKIIIVSTGILIFSFLALYFYMQHSFKKCCEEKNIRVSVQSYHFKWRSLGAPVLCLHGVNVKNKNPTESFVYMKADAIYAQLFLLPFIRSYGRELQVALEGKNFEIELPKGDVIAAQKMKGEIVYAKNIYRINRVTLEPVRINLSPERITPTKKDENHSNSSQLVLHQIKGDANYHPYKKNFKLSFEIPLPSNPQSFEKLYAVKALGNLHFLHADKTSLQKDDSGVRGHVRFTFQNFSNFLRHLRKSRLISNITRHLASIVGHELTVDNILTEEREFFPHGISLEIFFKKTGIYVGSFKL